MWLSHLKAMLTDYYHVIKITPDNKAPHMNQEAFTALKILLTTSNIRKKRNLIA